MKTVAVCWLFMTDCRFPKKLESPDILCEIPLPVVRATDSGLKCFVGVSVKVRILNIWPVGCQQL